MVPSPILKSCLDDMIDAFRGNPFDDDSDDENGKSSKKSAPKKVCTSTSDEYTGSLRIKEGRNVNNILYFVDHTKLQNNGDGLLPEARNELYVSLEKAQCEADALNRNLTQITSETAQLLSEPKNEDLALELEKLEIEMKELSKTLESARAYASNEKYAKQLKKRIEHIAASWRKRKRQCMDFIGIMEESTEGTISRKKCLNGDGPIDIESDEAAIKGAISFAKKTRARSLSAGGNKGGLERERGSNDKSSLTSDEKFVGVKLDSQGKPERVYLDEE